MELFRQVFNYLDKTKCGLIVPEYFGELLRISGFTPSQAEIRELQGKYAQRGMSFDEFIALISISLGVLNLLPIPLLDGGHLMYYTIDLLRSVLSKVGEPLSEKELTNFLEMMNLSDKDTIDYEELCSTMASYDM